MPEYRIIRLSFMSFLISLDHLVSEDFTALINFVNAENSTQDLLIRVVLAKNNFSYNSNIILIFDPHTEGA